MHPIYVFVAGIFAAIAVYADNHLDQVDKVATKSSLAASGATIVFGLTEGEWTVIAIICGILFSAITTAAAVWVKWVQVRRIKRPK